MKTNLEIVLGWFCFNLMAQYQLLFPALLTVHLSIHKSFLNIYSIPSIELYADGVSNTNIGPARKNLKQETEN